MRKFIILSIFALSACSAAPPSETEFLNKKLLVRYTEFLIAEEIEDAKQVAYMGALLGLQDLIILYMQAT